MFWLAQWWKSRGSNFGTVEPSRIFRGADPFDAELLDLIRQFKLRTVLDLRKEFRGGAPVAVKISQGVAYRHAALDDKPGMDIVDVPLIEACAALIADPNNQPIFVHCAGGRHRTGAVVACYRVKHCGWTTDLALEEANEFGLYGAGGHQGYVDYVKSLRPETLS